MKNLPLPARDDARDQLEKALEVYLHKGAQKGYDVSAAELDSVLALYDHYDAGGGAPSNDLKGLGLPTTLRAAIYAGYDFTQAGGKLNSIRTQILSTIERCPICGISAPRELDHYLPKSAYQFFAIYVRNLVPLCHECNQSKGASIAAAANNLFIHPYFEQIPDVQFLRASVDIDNGGLVVEYEVDEHAALPDLMKERLAFQLERLKLNDRYQREINTYLVSHATGLEMCFDTTGVDGVRTFLERQATKERRAFHRNHWRPVLLEALREHDEFCDGGFQAVLPAA